uniref:Serine proteinase inhibitor n=1 Tax=Amblyomma variegatum TaxID=34610 RepID=F0J9T6_AMBVA|nr:TPA_inf: serine proteinase inhibitor [Amblyomma variegatum]
MRSILFSLAACALVPSVLSDQRGERNNEDCPAMQTCVTPEWPFYKNLSDPNDKSDILFIYNSTSELCEKVLIDPTYRNHTYKSRFDCVSACNPGQGAPFCAAGPIEPCNDTASNRTDHYEYDNTAYFYNVTSMQCQEYLGCVDYLDRTDDVNYYITEHFCMFECGGFK